MKLRSSRQWTGQYFCNFLMGTDRIQKKNFALYILLQEPKHDFHSNMLDCFMPELCSLSG